MKIQEQIRNKIESYQEDFRKTFGIELIASPTPLLINSSVENIQECIDEFFEEKSKGFYNSKSLFRRKRSMEIGLFKSTAMGRNDIAAHFKVNPSSISTVHSHFKDYMKIDSFRDEYSELINFIYCRLGEKFLPKKIKEEYLEIVL